MEKTEDSTANVSRCHLCGVGIHPMDEGICYKCIGSFDVTKGISKEFTLKPCTKCDSHKGPLWIKNSWRNNPRSSKSIEDAEWIEFCLENIKGLEHVIIAQLNCEEKYGELSKINLKIQREIYENIFVEKSIEIKCVRESVLCDNCKNYKKLEEKWEAIVKLRQKGNHKLNLYYIEQMLLKDNIHKKAFKIVENKDDLDFYFRKKASAMEFIAFIRSKIMFRCNKAISTDNTSKKSIKHHILTLDLPTINKGDLITLPQKIQKTLNVSSCCLVIKVNSLIHLFDILKCKVHTMDTWPSKVLSFCNKEHLIEYKVLGLKNGFNYIELQEINNDKHKVGICYFGDKLKINDKVLGYDLTNVIETKCSYANVVVVKKVWEDEKKLEFSEIKRVFDITESESQEDEEYIEFMKDFEEELTMEYTINNKNEESFSEKKKSKHKKKDKIKNKEEEVGEQKNELAMKELTETLEYDTSIIKQENRFAAINNDSYSEDDT